MELVLEHPERKPEPPLRISGVVAMCNDVRRRVAAGLTPEAREELRAEVAASLHQIEELCAAHGASPEDLPGPSRSAYRYLKTIDWNGVPLPSADGGAGGPSTHLKGLLRSYLHIQHDLQHAKSEGARQRALERARRVAERVQELCGEGGPEALSSKERAAYLHLKELAEGRSDPGADVRLLREAYQELGLEEPASVSTTWCSTRCSTSGMALLTTTGGGWSTPRPSATTSGGSRGGRRRRSGSGGWSRRRRTPRFGPVSQPRPRKCGPRRDLPGQRQAGTTPAPAEAGGSSRGAAWPTPGRAAGRARSLDHGRLSLRHGEEEVERAQAEGS